MTSGPRSSALADLLDDAGRYVAAGDHAAAILTLQRATHAAPNNPSIHHDLGFLCLQAGRLPEAIAALRTALRLDPTFAQASLCLGIALQDHDDTSGAEAAYRTAIALQPSLTVAHVCLGALLESRGELAGALASFRAGAGSASATAWTRMASARALILVDRDLEAEPLLRTLVGAGPNAMAQEMLGTVLANTGRFDEARDCYERAIEAAPALAGAYYELTRCRRIVRSDAPLLQRMRAALESPTITADARIKVHLGLGKALDDLGDPSAAMQHFDLADEARSRLLRFDAVAFERRVDRLIAQFTKERLSRARLATTNDAGHGKIALCIMGLPRSGTTLLEQLLASHPQVHGAGELPFWIHRGDRWLSGDSGIPEDSQLLDLATDYTALLRGLAPQADRVIDKMPLNILGAGLIHLALPSAILIHCRRAPLDVALSIHRTYFNPQVALPTGGRGLVAMIEAVERLCAHWRTVLPTERFIEVDYEQLVTDPDATMRRLLAACELSWDETWRHPERTARLIKTPSKWQARQPVHRDAIDAWRRYAPWLGPLAALEKLRGRPG